MTWNLLLTLLHPEWQNLYEVWAILSAIRLRNQLLNFICKKAMLCLCMVRWLLCLINWLSSDWVKFSHSIQNWQRKIAPKSLVSMFSLRNKNENDQGPFTRRILMGNPFNLKQWAMKLYISRGRHIRICQIMMYFSLRRWYLSWQMVQIQMKCSIMRHFVWVILLCQITYSIQKFLEKYFSWRILPPGSITELLDIGYSIEYLIDKTVIRGTTIVVRSVQYFL